MAGDVVCVVGGEEQHRLADTVCFGQIAERYGLDEFVGTFARGLAGTPRHLGIVEVGRYAVGADAVASVLAHSIPWHKIPLKRRREILVPEGVQPRQARPIRSENRATLVTSIARGRRWLDELTTDATATADSIAKREGCSARKVNMTISLAFLAPDLVKTAPHGTDVTRLVDLPAEWSR